MTIPAFDAIALNVRDSVATAIRPLAAGQTVNLKFLAIFS